MIVTSLILSSVAIILTCVNLILTLWAVIELRSFNKSTHQVQYVNPEENMSGPEIAKFFTKIEEEEDYDNLP